MEATRSAARLTRSAARLSTRRAISTFLGSLENQEMVALIRELALDLACDSPDFNAVCAKHMPEMWPAKKDHHAN